MRWGVRVGEVPRALWVQVVLSLTAALVFLVVGIVQGRLLSLIGLPLSVILSWFLLRRSRLVWTLLVAGGILVLVSAAFEYTPWWNLVLDVVSTALLLFPAVLHFIWGGRARRFRVSLGSRKAM